MSNLTLPRRSSDAAASSPGLKDHPQGAVSPGSAPPTSSPVLPREIPLESRLTALRLPPTTPDPAPGATPPTAPAAAKGAAVTALLEKLLDPKTRNVSATLAKLHDLKEIDSTVRALTASLRSPHDDQKARACLALRLIFTSPRLEGHRLVSAEAKAGAAIALSDFLRNPASDLKVRVTGSPSIDASRTLISLLPRLSSKQTTLIVESLCSTVRDGSASENHRIRAADTLRGLRESTVNSAVTKAVGELGSALLTDRSGVVRYTAADVIAAIGPERVAPKMRTRIVADLISALGERSIPHHDTIRSFACAGLGRFGTGMAESALAVKALRNHLPLTPGSSESERKTSQSAAYALFHIASAKASKSAAASAAPELLEVLKYREPGPGFPRRMLGHYHGASKALGELVPHLGPLKSRVASEMVRAIAEVVDGRYADGNHITLSSTIALGRIGREATFAMPTITRMLEKRICTVEGMNTIGALYHHSANAVERRSGIFAVARYLGSENSIEREASIKTLSTLLSTGTATDPAIKELTASLRRIATDKRDPASSAAERVLRGRP